MKQTAEQFVEELWEENQVLYKASQIQIKAFYDSNPSKDRLYKNFVRRMTNERMNMVEIAKAIAASSYDKDPKELVSLAKQMLDEANHYRMVHDIIPHVSGQEVDLARDVPTELADLKTKGARIAERYNVENDEIALALYQSIVEGHASCNWQVMADSLEDPVLSSTYAKIAADERFHAKLGKSSLAKLLDTEEKQAYARELAKKMRKDLYVINCGGNLPIEESRKMIEEYYGEDWLSTDHQTVGLKEIY
jgi:rubrerythrin